MQLQLRPVQAAGAVGLTNGRTRKARMLLTWWRGEGVGSAGSLESIADEAVVMCTPPIAALLAFQTAGRWWRREKSCDACTVGLLGVVRCDLRCVTCVSQRQRRRFGGCEVLQRGLIDTCEEVEQRAGPVLSQPPPRNRESTRHKSGRKICRQKQLTAVACGRPSHNVYAVTLFGTKSISH